MFRMQIDIYADIACPWCFIGERRIRAALTQLPDINARMTWRPYQLQPGLPPEGLPWQEFAAKKFGSEARMAALTQYVAEQGRGDGIDFRFDRIQRANNTVDAHRLILFAAESGRSWDVAESLFDAYFVLGRNLNDRNDLLASAEAGGLDRTEADLLLDSGRLTDEVHASQDLAARLGVEGVPFYVIDGKYGLSGAQPVDVFVKALQKIAAG